MSHPDNTPKKVNFDTLIRSNIALGITGKKPETAGAVSLAALQRMSAEKRMEYLVEIPEVAALLEELSKQSDQILTMEAGMAFFQQEYVKVDPNAFAKHMAEKAVRATTQRKKAERILEDRVLAEIGAQAARDTIIASKPREQLLAAYARKLEREEEERKRLEKIEKMKKASKTGK